MPIKRLGQLGKLNARAFDYETVIVKQGYLWPGAVTNDFSTLPFKHLEGEHYYVRPECA